MAHATAHDERRLWSRTEEPGDLTSYQDDTSAKSD